MTIPPVVKTIYAQASRWAFPVLIVVLLLSLRECRSTKNELQSLSLNLDSLALQAKHFENEKGQAIAENKQLQVASGRQLKALTDTIFNLKKQDAKRIKSVPQYARIIQQGNFNNKLAQWTDTAKADTGGHAGISIPKMDPDVIRLPKPFSFADSTISFAGAVTRAGVRIDSIRIENVLHYRSVINKTGFLNLGRSTTVQVLNSNPGITTLGVTSIIVPARVNWWNRWGKPLAAALLAGAAVDHFRK